MMGEWYNILETIIVSEIETKIISISWEIY